MRPEMRAIAEKVQHQDYGFADLSLDELRGVWEKALAPKWHLQPCLCPTIDGVLGFTQKCPVHGGRDRSDFARLTALRVEIASRLSTPASARKWGKEGSK